MASSQKPDAANQGTQKQKHGSKKGTSSERNQSSYEDTDAPSVSPISLQFFKLGLPPAGYLMLLTEIIPSFIYLALANFHIGADEEDAWLWFTNHFYSVLFAIPSSFIIAILSDGYTCGKFIACIVMLTLMFITGLCSLLQTIQGLSPTIALIVNHISPYSIFVFYVTLPIRVTIFTDVFAKHKTHEHARKAFAALWVCNLTGVCVLVSVYQHYFEKDDAAIHFGLLIMLLALNLVYFMVTVVILISLPLELPLKNQFLYHISIMWFAMRRQPLRYLREKNHDWLGPALEKCTQTEVKRTRSLAQLLMMVFPMICFASGHAYIYYNWYNYGHSIKWFGPMIHSYHCFYGHIMFTIIFIGIVEVIVLPTSYHCCGHFNGIWLLLAGFFIMGIPLSTLLAVEYSCSHQNITRFNSPSVRIINGYPERILVHSDWLGPNGGKGRASIRPGEVLTIHPPKNASGTYGEATVFAYPAIKVTDFLVMTLEHGLSSTYFLSPFQNQHLKVRDYDVRRAPQMVLNAPFHRGKGTVIISCSPDFYNKEVDLKCTYDYHMEVEEMPVQHLCTTKSIHNGVTMETHPVLIILNWPARVYTCTIADDFVTIEVELDDFIVLHLASHIDPETESRIAKKLTFHILGADDYREAFLVSTDLDILRCQIPYAILILQLVTHGLSSALVLVSIYTMHSLHGPPRMRMTSYALPHIGIYIGLCIERGVLSSSIPPFGEAIIFEVEWAIGFVVLTLIAVYCRFELHSWDIHWRPSIFWTVRAWLRIRLHHRWMVKEKAPRLQNDTLSVSSAKGILQHDVTKDKTIDDDKSDRKVTFSEDE